MKSTSRTFLCRGLLAAGAVMAPMDLEAAEVKIFRADTRDAVAQGTLDALSLDPLGALELAHRVERLAMPEEPFVFGAAAHPEGWVLGTGNSGKVLLVSRTGKVEELHSASESEIFAVTSAADGTVYAGSSPYGKVYRISRDGEASVVFEPPDAYVWALALDTRGRLLVATGLAGRLYRVDPEAGPDQTAEVLYESADSHVRSLAALADGRVLVGTAGQGLVLELEDGPAGGRGGTATVAVATLYDAVQPEVLAFTAAGEGEAYAAAVASEASLVDLSQTQPPPQKSAESEDEAQVTVSAAQNTVGSRSAGYSGPRSVVLRIRPDGRVDEVVALQDETVHSLRWHGGALWIGTGEEGRLYRWHQERLILERDLEERQVVSIVANGDGAAAVTTNAAGLYEIPGGKVDEGTYTSSVLDAGQVARFGSFLWEGEMPGGASLELEARSGMSATPDATWTEWQKAAGGREIALGDLAHGRYVQWRAKLRKGRGEGPRLVSSELSYRQQNLKPRIESFEALDPGQILVPSNFNPQNQAFEPWNPNREGIFTSLRPEKDDDPNRLKTLWKKGYQSLRWQASDGNEDALRYALAFRRDGDDGTWLEIVDDLEDSHYSFDATVLPDGVYRFRLAANDADGRSDEEGLTADKVSEPVVVDHSPPGLVSRKRAGATLEVELHDLLNPMRDVVYSVDAKPWKSARAADGLLDGRREVVKLDVPEDARMLLIRVTDAAFNVITYDLLNPPSP